MQARLATHVLVHPGAGLAITATRAATVPACNSAEGARTPCAHEPGAAQGPLSGRHPWIAATPPE